MNHTRPTDLSIDNTNNSHHDKSYIDASMPFSSGNGIQSNIISSHKIQSGGVSSPSAALRTFTPMLHSTSHSTRSKNSLLLDSLSESAHHLFKQKRYKAAYDLYKQILQRDMEGMPELEHFSAYANGGKVIEDSTLGVKDELLQEQIQKTERRSIRSEHQDHETFNSLQSDQSKISMQKESTPYNRENNGSQVEEHSYRMLIETPFHYFAMSKCAFAMKNYATAKKDALYALKLLEYQSKHSIMSELRSEHVRLKKLQQQKMERKKKFFITSVPSSQSISITKDDKESPPSQDAERVKEIQDTGIRSIIGLSCFFLKEYTEAIQYLTNVILYYQPQIAFEASEEKADDIIEPKEELLMFTSKYRAKRKKGVSIYDENDFSYSEEIVQYSSDKPLFKREKNDDKKLDAISAQEFERAVLFRAKTYEAMGRFRDAIVDVNRLLAIYNSSGFLLRYRGILRFEMKDYTLAIEDFTNVIQLKNGRDYKAFMERGKTYIALQLFDKALADLQLSLQLQPQYSITWKLLGRVYLQNRQFVEAEEALSRTVSLDEGDKEGCKLLGDVCKHLGKLSRAKLYYHKALLLDPKFQEAVDSLNEMLELNGKKVISPVHVPFREKKKKYKIALDRNSIRLGVLIGNSNYTHGNHLRTPQHDVIAIQSTLYDLNFTCTALQNATRNRILEEVNILCERRRQYMNHKVNEGKLSIVVFYFNGHAFQYESRNYLIPIDFRWREYETMEEMLDASIPVDDITKLIEEADPDGVNVYIFDCMRPMSLIRSDLEEKAFNLQNKTKAKQNEENENKFNRTSNRGGAITDRSESSRSFEKGRSKSTNNRSKTTVPTEEEEYSETMLRSLRAIKLPNVSISRLSVGMSKEIHLKEESIIAYSHLPNTMLLNDQGFNMGLFTRILIEHLQMDSLFLDLTGMEHNRALFYKVKQLVQEESFGKQVPWYMSTLSRSVILNKLQN